MKQFDSASIQSRLISILSSNVNWSQIVRDSALSSLLGGIAESNAEVVRYLEYLLKESKWQYAQNLTSLLTEAPYLGYTPQRKVSAIGTVTISHSSMLAAAGISVFNKSQLDSLIAPYSGSPAIISIPRGSVLVSTKGIYYVTSDNATYTTGDKYIDVPVIQGQVKSSSTTMLGNSFETIGIHSDDSSGYVEAADNAISETFFNVYVTPYGTSTPIQYTRVEDLYLAGSMDRVYEVSVSKDFSVVTVKFGNGVAGARIPASSVVTVSYLSTLGENGNENDNFTVNRFEAGSGLPPMFATNFESLLGGSAEDTLEEIRNKAPLQYLIDGAIITANAYQHAIESIPYVKLATVYSKLYTDPVTLVVQNAIMFSALSITGTTPPSSIMDDVRFITRGKISPLDFLQYEPPQYLHLKLGVLGKYPNTTGDISSIVKSRIYEKYGIMNQQFKQTFDNSLLVSQVQTDSGLNQIQTLVEAVCDMPASTFTPSNLYAGYYSHPFSFDRSYVKMRGFDDGQSYCIKLQIDFLCPTCLENSRTLFLVRDTTQSNSLSCSFSTSNATTGDIIICGVTVALNSDDVSSSPKLATKIAAQSIINYSITNPSPGVITITADSELIGAPSISTDIEGISIQRIENTAYKVLQYPLITNVTTGNYMSQFVLNADTAPFVIPPTQTNPLIMATTYVPFHVTFDYFSLATSDYTITPLASGTISIPESLNEQVAYLRFSETTSEWLDANVRIQATAVPMNSVIDSYYDNNIFLISEEDITVEVN